MKKSTLHNLFILFTSMFLSACASTTESGAVGVNRKQFLLMPAEQVNQMALQSFEEVKKEASAKRALDSKPALLARVRGVAERLIPYTATFRGDAVGWAWETHVVTSDELNAYCMPGGKIVFYSGIIEKLNMTDGEIAAVMGHEIAHALREHGRERVSEELAKQFGIGILVQSGAVGQSTAQIINQGAVYLRTLPHGRGQETEADDIGLEIMARAGYNPAEAVNLWIKMSKAAQGSKPPEILSTHPSDDTRIARIQGLLPKVQPLYLQASKK